MTMRFKVKPCAFSLRLDSSSKILVKPTGEDRGGPRGTSDGLEDVADGLTLTDSTAATEHVGGPGAGRLGGVFVFLLLVGSTFSIPGT
jgi:hypothetical protein